MEMGWAPAIEMFEKEDRFVVKAELPGMKKEEDYYCCERSYGSFFRSIAIPSNMDADKIKASYEEGVLEINIPKAVKVKPKKIAFSAKETGKIEKHKKKAKASK